MSTRKTEAGTASKAVETTNSNGTRLVRSKASNFGQFGYGVTLELTPAQVEEILAEGVLHIAQRAPASRVEKILAGYDKRSDMPDGWTRDQIAYSDELARTFEIELAKEIAKVAHVKVSSVTAERYEVTEREPAYAEAKKLVKAAAKMGKAAVASLAKNANYTGSNLTVENVEFLQAIEAARQAQLAKMFVS